MSNYDQNQIVELSDAAMEAVAGGSPVDITAQKQSIIAAQDATAISAVEANKVGSVSSTAIAANVIAALQVDDANRFGID